LSPFLPIDANGAYDVISSFVIFDRRACFCSC
jgi:hypothetical protein